jgi:hypothetical protein
VTRTSYPHLAYGHDVRTEGDVAFDLEPLAAAQRRCLSGELLLGIGLQSVIVLIQRDDRLLAAGAGPHLVAGELVDVGAHDEQVVCGLLWGEPRAGNMDRPGARDRADRRAHRRLELDHRGAFRIARVDGRAVDGQVWRRRIGGRSSLSTLDGALLSCMTTPDPVGCAVREEPDRPRIGRGGGGHAGELGEADRSWVGLSTCFQLVPSQCRVNVLKLVPSVTVPNTAVNDHWWTLVPKK